MRSQLQTVPVGGADTISIVFSEDVNVSASSLTVFGLRTGNLPAVADFSYDATTHTGVWRFGGFNFYGDQYLLAVSDGVTDVEGNWLDGEWVNPAHITTANAAVSEFPSGNGAPGGWFRFVMNVRPGDVDLNGVIDAYDEYVLSETLGLSYGQVFGDGDFDGDGDVDDDDVDGLIESRRLEWNGVNYCGVSLWGDCDGDLDVDDADLDRIADNAGLMTGATWEDGDCNGDGAVTMADLDMALALYGMGIDAVW